MRTPHNAARSDAARGFTLIELLVVMSILAILMAITVGAGYAISSNNRRGETKTTLANLETMVDEYHRAYGHYPVVIEPDDALAVDAFIEAVNGVGAIGEIEDSGGEIIGEGMLGQLTRNVREDGGTWIVIDGWDNPIICQPHPDAQNISNSNADREKAAMENRPLFISAGRSAEFGDNDDIASDEGL